MHPQAGIGTVMEDVPQNPRFLGIVLAQVIGISSNDHAVQVIFTTLSGVFTGADGEPLKVKVLQRRAGLNGALVELPQVGEWGLVCFPNGSDQLAVWLGSIHRDLNNLAWDGKTPSTRLDQHDSGVYSLIDNLGNVDQYFPDGTYLRVGTGATLAPRQRHERQGQTKRNAPFTGPSAPTPATVILKHSSGSSVMIDPSGKITITGTADIKVQSSGMVTLDGAGPAQTKLGGGTDFIVLLQWLLDITSWMAAHTHQGVVPGLSQSGPPAAPPTAPVLGVHYTLNTKAG